MKGASWVESSTPMAMTRSTCETPGVPKNLSACKSEFDLELSSRLASVSTSPVTVDKGGMACSCNSSCHEGQREECHEVSFGDEESDLEHIPFLFLQATQAICGAWDAEGAAWTRAAETESMSTEEVASYRMVLGNDYATLAPCVDTPNMDTVQENAVLREGHISDDEHVVFELSEIDVVSQTQAIAVEETKVFCEENTVFELPAELSTEASPLSGELHAESLPEPYSGSLDESSEKVPVRLFITDLNGSMSKRGELKKVDSVRATDNGERLMSSSAEDVFQDDGDCVVAHDVLSTPSGLRHGGGYHGVVGKGDEEPEPAFESVARPDKFGKEGLSKAVESQTADCVDNEGELLFPQGMSVTTKTREHPGGSHVASANAREAPVGEKKMPGISREIRVVLGDRHKLRGDEKARPVRNISKSRFAEGAGVSHGVTEGVVSREGVSNPSGVYSQLNQRALRSSMIHQIVDKAELWLGRDQAQMVIDLKPDILGRVHLKISEEAGKVVAEIRAENASTKALIESGLPDLETALSEKGFSFDAITVSWTSGRGSVGTGFDGNNMSWFSEANSRGHNDNLRQPQGVTNTVGRDDTTSLARGFGVKAYLDYIV